MSEDLSQVFQGPNFALTFLYYFSLTTVIGVFGSVQILDWSFTAAKPYQLALVLALPIALFSACTKQTKQIDFSFADPRQFRMSLNDTLTEFGYEEVGESDFDSESQLTFVTFERPGLAGWYSGKVYVAIAQKKAVISSRAAFIRQLQKRL